MLYKDASLYELYDMKDEVVETHNVFNDPRYDDAKRALVTEFEAWSSQQAARYPGELVSYAKR